MIYSFEFESNDSDMMMNDVEMRDEIDELTDETMLDLMSNGQTFACALCLRFVASVLI